MPVSFGSFGDYLDLNTLQFQKLPTILCDPGQTVGLVNRNPSRPHTVVSTLFPVCNTVSKKEGEGSAKPFWLFASLMIVGGVNVNLEQLVREAQKGDDQAFYQLILMHKERMYRVAYAFLRTETDALEAIQEATCRAYLKLSAVKEPAYFSTWLTRLLIHLCIDEQKRRKRWILEETDRERIDPQTDHTDERILLQAAMERLSPIQRNVIILKYFEDLTIREIASLLDHPEGTIKTWLHKALGALRHDLGRGW